MLGYLKDNEDNCNLYRISGGPIMLEEHLQLVEKNNLSNVTSGLKRNST